VHPTRKRTSVGVFIKEEKFKRDAIRREEKEIEITGEMAGLTVE
jgi:hypothetical protein